MQSSKDYIRNSSIIHISLVLGQLLFLALSVWVIKPTRDRMYDLHFFVTDAIFVIGGIVIAYLLYIKYARETKKMRGIREKLLTYRK